MPTTAGSGGGRQVAIVASVGHTDLQLLMRNADLSRAVYVPIERRAMASAHSWLEDHRDRWSVCRLPDSAPRAMAHVEWSAGSGFQDIEIDGAVFHASTDEAGRLEFVAPKLDPLVTQMTLQNLSPGGVLVVATRQRERSEDPIAAGPILANWMAEQFLLSFCGAEGDGAGAAAGAAFWIAALKDGEALAEAAPGEQLPLFAAARIDEAIKKLREIVGPGATCYLALAGGMPPFKPVIEQSARLRFDNRVEDAGVREGQERHWTLPGGRRTSAVDSLKARRRVIELVRAGNFEAARLSIDPEFSRDEQPDKRWAQVVSEAEDQIVRAPPIGGKRHRCLGIALRLEAALTAERWIEAIVATKTFFDAAVLDGIEALPWVEELDDVEGTLRVTNGEPPPELLEGDVRGLAPLRQVSAGNLYAYRADPLLLRLWATSGPRPRGSNALKAFRGALYQPQTLDGCTVRPVQWRNVAVHGTLDGRQLDRCQRLFLVAGLWNDVHTDRELGSRFLMASVVAPVLKAFGHADAATQYRKIVSDVESALLDHKLA